MIEVQEGIYRVGEELPNPVRKPLILVHPWFEEGFHSFRRVGEFKRDYESALTKLLGISRGKRNIFVFEVGTKVENEETPRRIARIAGDRGVYMISTFENPFGASSIPESLSWEGAAQFLKSQSSDFYFAGGLLGRGHSYYDGSEVWSGCLGTAYEELGRRGIGGQFLFNCCFTTPEKPRRIP